MSRLGKDTIFSLGVVAYTLGTVLYVILSS